MRQTAPTPSQEIETATATNPGGERDQAVVLHIIAGLAVGGAERMLEKLATSPSAYRHVVVSLSESGPIGAALAAAGVQVHSLNLTDLRGIVAGFRQLRAIACSVRPVAIQGWMTHGNLVASFLRMTGLVAVPVYWGVRQSIDFTGERLRTKTLIYLSALLARTPDAIVYNSRAGALQHEAIGYPRAKRRLIPNGFDLGKYRPWPDERARMRSGLGVADEVVLVGMIARVHPVKNHCGFLDAAAMIARERPNVRFLLAGRGVGASEKQFMAMVADAGIALDRLILLDELSDVASVMRCLDIAVNPSFAESFPNAVGEALACGVPCVVTQVGDSALLVGDAGIVCAGTNGSDIARAIRVLLDEDPDRRATRAARAVERIHAHYSLPVVVSQFEDLYRADRPGVGADTSSSQPACRTS